VRARKCIYVSKDNALFAIIQAAGWPIWPLLLASIIAVALIIERMISLRESKIVPPTLLSDVIAVYARQGVNADVSRKEASDPALNPYTGTLPDSAQQELARRYAELFSVYLKHHAIVDRADADIVSRHDRVHVSRDVVG